MSESTPNDASENPLNPLDLSELKNFSFGTQWTQDKSPRTSAGDAPAARRSRDDAPKSRDRRGFRRPNQGAGPADGAEADRTRPSHPAADRPDRSGGAPRRDRRAPLSRGGPSRPEEARGAGAAPRGRPQAVGPYISPYYAVTFYPEDAGFVALAKVMRDSCRTYELFEIARVVVGKNDRFVAVLTHKAEDENAARPTPFAISVPDGIPFENEAAAVDHVLRHHLDRFFEIAEVEVEAPTGNFQVVNRCQITGELLGPPNYHLYNQIVAQHHQSAGIRIPLDTYRSSKIESVREPEVIAQWLDKMKKGTRYTWKTAEPKAPDAPAEPVSAIEPTPAPEASEAAAPSPEEAVVAEPAADAVPPAAPDEAPAALVPEAVSFTSLDEAREHLLAHAREQVVRLESSLRVQGRLLESLPKGEIRRTIEGQLERQQRFPLETANALRGRLRREGFTIFKKGAKGISYVCAVKRKFRTPGQTFADRIDQLITFIEANPMVKRSELAGKYLGIQLPEPPAEGAEAAPIAEADQVRFRDLQQDLRWLVGEGYVTEFIDGRLFISPPLPEARKREAENAAHDPENFPEATES